MQLSIEIIIKTLVESGLHMRENSRRFILRGRSSSKNKQEWTQVTLSLKPRDLIFHLLAGCSDNPKLSCEHCTRYSLRDVSSDSLLYQYLSVSSFFQGEGRCLNLGLMTTKLVIWRLWRGRSQC